MRVLGIIGVVIIGTSALVGCREDEQARLIDYQPGVYKGKPDTPLSAKALADARKRILLQAGSVGMSGGGSRPVDGDVRRPGQPSNLDRDALARRLRAQGG